MDNDDLFDIIEPSEEQKDNISDSEGDFVQDESFVNSLDFVNGFSDVDDSEPGKVPDESDNETDENAEEALSVSTEAFNISDEKQTDDETEAEAAPSDEIEHNDDDDESVEDLDDEDYEQIMMITEGTSVTGSITTDCSLDVFGTINGDIFCDGKLSISGKVVGNSHASEVMINAHRVEGNIECKGVVKIGKGSVIIGDISAGAAVIAGAVKGTLDVKGPVILDSTAVIKGNIKAKSVQLINGAVLEGFCSLEYANSDVDSIFE